MSELIREEVPAGFVLQHREYELDTSSPVAGGVAWIDRQFAPVERGADLDLRHQV